MKSKKTGMSMTGAKNIFNERKKQGIKPIRCVCSKCLYHNRKLCRFGKEIVNRKYCIKFTQVEGYNGYIKKQSTAKKSKNNK